MSSDHLVLHGLHRCPVCGREPLRLLLCSVQPPLRYLPGDCNTCHGVQSHHCSGALDPQPSQPPPGHRASSLSLLACSLWSIVALNARCTWRPCALGLHALQSTAVLGCSVHLEALCTGTACTAEHGCAWMLSALDAQVPLRLCTAEHYCPQWVSWWWDAGHAGLC